MGFSIKKKLKRLGRKAKKVAKKAGRLHAKVLAKAAPIVTPILAGAATFIAGPVGGLAISAAGSQIGRYAGATAARAKGKSGARARRHGRKIGKRAFKGGMLATGAGAGIAAAAGGLGIAGGGALANLGGGVLNIFGGGISKALPDAGTLFTSVGGLQGSIGETGLEGAIFSGPGPALGPAAGGPGASEGGGFFDTVGGILGNIFGPGEITDPRTRGTIPDPTKPGGTGTTRTQQAGVAGGLLDIFKDPETGEVSPVRVVVGGAVAFGGIKLLTRKAG